MIAQQQYEVWGLRRQDENSAQVELRPLDGMSGHTTITVAMSDLPMLGATVTATYAVETN